MQLSEQGYILDLNTEEAVKIFDELYLTAARARGNGKSRMLYNYTMAWIKIKEALIEKEMEYGKKGEPSFWEEFQYMLYDSTNAQAEEAIKILQEKLKKNKKKSRNIADSTVYTDYKHEAWVAALNILATEFYVKTNQPEKYTYYCEQLNKLDDTDLECLHIWLSLNRHITSLGHMMSHGDYEQAKDNLFEFLEERNDPTLNT